MDDDDDGRVSLPTFIPLTYHLIYPFLQDVLSESSLNSTIAHSALPSSVEHCQRYNHKYNSYQTSGTKQLHRSNSNSNKKKKIIFQQYDVDNFSLPYYHAYIEHFHDSYDVCRYDSNHDNDDDDEDDDDEDDDDCDDDDDDNNNDSDDDDDDNDEMIIMMMMMMMMIMMR